MTSPLSRSIGFVNPHHIALNSFRTNVLKHTNQQVGACKVIPYIPFAHLCMNKEGSSNGQKKAIIPDNDKQPGQPTNNTIRRKRNRLQHWADPGARLITDVTKGETMIGTVKDVGPANSAWLDLNIRSIKGRSVRGRLRLDKNKLGSKQLKPGSQLPVYIYNISPASCRIEVKTGNQNAKISNIIEEELTNSKYRNINELEVGMKIDSGTILGLGKYGAVIDVSVYRIGKKQRKYKFHALLPRNYYQPDWISNNDVLRPLVVNKTLNVGDDLANLFVRQVTVDPPYLILDTKEIDQDQIKQEIEQKKKNRRLNQRKKPLNQLSVGEIRRGIICKVAEFGVFINLGFKQNALLHYSEMTKQYQDLKWKQVFHIDTPLYVQITKLNAETTSNDAIAVKLILSPTVEIELLEERIQSPMATQLDIDLLATLVKREEKLNGAVGALLDPAEFENSKSVQNEEAETKEVKIRVSEDESVEDEDADEDAEKFSDEYFEDKYGY